MKKKPRETLQGLMPFNRMTLDWMKEDGYKYVQVKGYTRDKRLDYMEPRYLVLVPLKRLSQNGMDIEIYEPITSNILLSWADNEVGVKVMVSFK
mgnify:CR=1 FL=1